MGQLERKFEAIRELREEERYRQGLLEVELYVLRKLREEREREIMLETQEGQENENEI